MDVFKQLCMVIRDFQDTCQIPATITPEMSFVDDLSFMDSLDYVELIMAVEDVFGVRIEDEEAEAVVTVQQLVDLIESKVDAEVLD